MSGKFELVLVGYEGDLEVARILRAAAADLENQTWTPEQPKRIRDINGNRVGYWAWTG